MKIHQSLFLFLSVLDLGRCVDTRPENKEHRLQKTSSGLYIASNRGYPFHWHDVSDGLSEWAEQDQERYQQFQEKIKTHAFTYIDVYAGNRLVLDNVPEGIENIIQVVSRRYTNGICDKLGFAEAARKAGLEGTAIPWTFDSKEEAIEKLSGSDVEFVYIKDPTGTFGNDIYIERVEDLPQIKIPDDYLIQEAMTKNLALIEGKKFELRTYLVIMNGALYFSRHGKATVHPHPYDPNSTSTKVQVDFNPQLSQELDESPNLKVWVDSFVELGKKIGPMLEDILVETANDPLRFSYMGADFLPFEDGSVRMIEINSYPPLRSDIMKETILSLLGLDRYDDELSSKLVKVWELPENKRKSLTREEL